MASPRRRSPRFKKLEPLRGNRRFAAGTSNGFLLSNFILFGRVVSLLNRAGRRGEYSIRVRADETNGADHYYQDHSQHHGVLCDILTFIVCPEFENEIDHGSPSE
jgi:hypothetical protein